MSYIKTCSDCRYFLDIDMLIDQEEMICLPAWANGVCKLHDMKAVRSRSACCDHEYGIVKDRMQKIAGENYQGCNTDLVKLAKDFCIKTECEKCPIKIKHCKKSEEECYINLVYWMRGIRKE